jgi:small subunit ribosomal protein S1
MSVDNVNTPAGLSSGQAEPDSSAENPVAAISGISEPAKADCEVSVAEASETSAATPQGGEVSSAGGEEAAESPGEAPGEGMGELLDQYAAPAPGAPEGEIVDARVIAVTELGVVVDVGSKSEGLIPASEFADKEGGIPFAVNQTVPVQFAGEEKEGYVIVSYLRARRKRAWENIEKSYRENQNLTGTIVDRIKGGLVVDLGIRAFLPASHLEVRPTHDLESWKGREIECRVLKMNRKRGNVVVSRRVILEEELKSRREEAMHKLHEGAVLTGKVKNLTEYGAFVDLGGIDGLLHVTDMTWGRIAHPSEAVQAGQEIEVKVLKFDREKSRVSLGRKQLLPDPWENVPQNYPVGTRVPGRVVGVTDYGAFVEIEPGVEGLVHVSEMSWSKKAKHPSKIVHVNDEVEVVVLDLKPAQRRISLGLKQTQPDPWDTLAEKYPVGTVVSGKVRNLTEFGAFVEIEEGIEGLIHVSDLSWTERVKDPSEVLKKGDTVEAKVLKLDRENRRLSLGIKQVNDIWSDWFSAHKLNSIVRGRVSRSTTFGVFVELAPGIEALCHISEIEGRPRGDKSGAPPPRGKSTVHLDVGQEYDFKIIKYDPHQHKIGLSYRAAQRQAERKEIEQYRSSKSSPTATIGDLILAKRESSS